MKKSFVLLILLLVLGVGGTCYIHTTVNAQKDQVTITETVLAGDPSVVEGVTVQARTHYDYHLFWDTTYTAGAKPSAETEFTFEDYLVYGEEPITYRGVYLETYMEYGIDLQKDISELSGFELAYREMYDALEPGEEMSRIVYVKDYYDFYPISGDIDFPGDKGKSYHGSFSSYPMDTVSGMEVYEAEKFMEYFKIPVLEEHTREISLQKGDGNLIGIGGGSTDSDEFYLYTRNAIGQKACYFTFDSHSFEGKVVDLSHIPGGYGIYCLPFLEDEAGKTRMDVEGLSMVYALNPEIWIESLEINEEKDKLLLTTREGEGLYFTVIAIDTMETLQKIEIAEIQDDYMWQIASYEDFMVWIFDERIAVASVNEEGAYQLKFVVSLEVENQKLYFGDVENTMDWNGEQLVISAFMMEEYGYHDTCGFYITVFDKKGLAYCGQYTSSLSTKYDHRYHSRCRPINYAPISVSWE